RRLAKFEYTGMELEELNKWYEEIYGKFGGEQQKVMGDLSANSKRATFYSLYRTLFMEDDGWAAGYAAGDSYMKRTLVSRKRQIVEKEQLIEAQKQDLTESLTKVRNWAVAAKLNGASDEAIQNKVQQAKEILTKKNLELKTQTTELNAETERLRGRGEQVKKLVSSHDEEMTKHRITAHEKRTKYGRTNYLGTARAKGSQ